jgi:Dockerin type I domain
LLAPWAELQPPDGFSFPTWVLGDANSDGNANIADVTFLINRIFSGGPGPNPDKTGDVNGDCAVNIADVTYMIARIFSGGAAPLIGCAP